ncbi:MAG: UDP-N-acetylmuramoyl-L-alanyl-D-glutamate--2, 6-diaminopimelate ligase [Acidimicrobiales bacterium]|nr:UDP-N-acetylmuramoyl-L-alanyl-D-glutamate--2, 6-diaminopimelate ligase [Acidimicrobiales bacterium]
MSARARDRRSTPTRHGVPARLRLASTLFIAKLILRTSRLFGRGGGSALPGLVAEALYPRIGRILAESFADGIIVITGTNGKTTTTKMLAEIAQANGKAVATNPTGSNLHRGILSQLIEVADLRGRIAADLAIFEVDEASMPAVCADLEPDVVVVLNLFRDQLDRYGELDTVADVIGRALAPLGAVVYLNADDPLVVSLRDHIGDGQVRYFGIDASDTERLRHDATADSIVAPATGEPLVYSKVFFGHLGHYRTARGDFVRPAADFALVQKGAEMSVTALGRTIPLTLELPGLYNAYNALAALAAATAVQVGPQESAAALANVDAAFGRVEQCEYLGRDLYLLLVKNPTGFNQIIQTFLLRDPDAHLMIAINDNAADGRDVSWLWDVSIEDISTTTGSVLVSGSRAAEMALRLKYAGFESHVVANLADAVDELVRRSEPGDAIYVLPTYTAMMELRSLIANEANLKEIWQ